MDQKPNDLPVVVAGADTPDTDMVDATIESEETKEVQKTVLRSGLTDDLFELIAQPLAKGNGFRVLWLGDSGQGKTYGNNLFIQWCLKNRVADLVFTLDTKDAHAVQYPGACERINPADLRANPPRPGEPRNFINFRGVAATRKLGEDCSADEVARLGWEIVTQQKTRVVLCIDELADATTGGQGWTDKTVAATYRKGRGVGLSITATTQLPQILPREAFALSEIVVLFRMSGREAQYLLDKRAITPESVEIIPNLTVGQCIVYDKNRGPLDGQVIKIGD